MGLGLLKALEPSSATTNTRIESFYSAVHRISRPVKRSRGGSMILRWVAPTVAETETGFRRLKGNRDMSATETHPLSWLLSASTSARMASRGTLLTSRRALRDHNPTAAQFQQSAGHPPVPEYV